MSPFLGVIFVFIYLTTPLIQGLQYNNNNKTGEQVKFLKSIIKIRMQTFSMYACQN